MELDGSPIHLTGEVQSVNLVTDRSITLSFALILPDEAFLYLSLIHIFTLATVAFNHHHALPLVGGNQAIADKLLQSWNRCV